MNRRFLAPFLVMLGLLWTAGTRPVGAQMRATVGIGSWTLVGDLRTASSLSTVTRITAGVGFGLPIRGAFSLRPEVVYTVRGATGETRLEDVPVRATFDLSYIDVPVLLVWTLDRGHGPRPSFFAGPSVSYRLDSRVRFRSPDGGPEFSDSDETVSQTGVGLVVGTEVAFGVSDLEWFVGARYGRGLTNARDAEPELHHSGYSAYFGVSF